MGVYLELKILPEMIGDLKWQEVYMESLELIKAYPFTDVIVESVKECERFTFISEVERNINCDEERYWSCIGDYKTRETAERFALYQDIENYRNKGVKEQGNKDLVNVEKDILIEYLEDGNYRSVFDAKSQGFSYHNFILAVAMLIESRFPKYAMVSGDINIIQAQKAQKWANEILKRPIELPVAVLPERLCDTYKGADLIEKFNLLYRNEGLSDNDIYKLFHKQDLKDYVLQRIKKYKSISVGVIDQFINWLNATGDMQQLIEIACFDEEGPKYEMVDFLKGVCNTWVMIPTEKFAFMKMANTDGVVDLFGQMHMMLFETMFAGKNIDIYISKDEVIRILSRYFPDKKSEISETIELKLEKISESIKKIKDRLDNIIKENEQFDEDENISENELTEEEILCCAIINYKYKQILNEIKETNKIEKDKHVLMYRFSIKEGIPLLEKEWEWIDKEQNEEVLDILVAFFVVGIESEEIRIIRNRLLQSREMCEFLVERFKDEELSEKVEECFRNA